MNQPDLISVKLQHGAGTTKVTSHFEDNWKQGRFVYFQFPHPDHDNESHKSDVYCIRSSENYLVSCGKDHTIRIWNISTQRLVLPPLFGHEGSVLCAQFHEEYDVIISGGSDANVIIWQFSTGNLIKRIEGAHSDSVLSLKFNDSCLVTGSSDSSIRVWDRKALSLTKTLNGHTAPVNSVQLTDEHIISASGDRTIRIWSLATGQCLKTIIGHEKGIACVQPTADGTAIVSGGSDMTIRLFSIGGAEVECLRGHSGLVRTVQVSPTGDAILKERTEPRSTPDAKADQSHCVDRIISGSYDGSIVIWMRGPDRRWLATHTLNFKDPLHHTSTQAPGEAVVHETANAGRIYSLQFDERRLICCGQGRRIVGWDFG